MSLVVKSWLLQTSPAKGEPYFRIVGRESGLLSFLLSLVGIDATTTMVVNNERIEFERGSLSGFERVVTPTNMSAQRSMGSTNRGKRPSVS